MKDFLFRNLSLKILSFFFAVSLWLFVNLKATAETTLHIPVVWENVPSFLAITNEVNDSIRVRVTGPRRILSNLEPTRFPVTLDLSDAKVGLSNYQINEKMIHLPPGLTATVLPPDTIQFKFELTVTKEVGVQPRFRGSPAPGYVVTGTEVDPQRVEVGGPQSEMVGIAQVDTEAIDLTGRKADFQARARLVLNQPHLWVKTGEDRVVVHVAVAEKTVQRLLKQVPLKVENEKAAVRLDPDRVDVLLEGPAAKIGELQPGEVTASVAVPDKVALPASLPVTVVVPVDGIRATSDPEKVTVKAPLPEDSE